MQNEVKHLFSLCQESRFFVTTFLRMTETFDT